MDVDHTIYAPYSRGLGAFGWALVALLTIIVLARLWVLLRRGKCAGELRKFGYWRRCAILAIFALAPVYYVWGSYPDPQFKLSKLKGLTPSQVIARFGLPRDKMHAAPPDDVTNESLLMFEYKDKYRWPSFSYGIMFGKNNQVKYVFVGSH